MRIEAGLNVNMEDYAAQINYFKSFSKEMWAKLTEETNLCVSAEKLVNTYPPSTGFRHGCRTQNFWTPVITGKLPAISTYVIFFCFQTLRLHFICHKNPDFMANCHFSSCTKTIYIFSQYVTFFFTCTGNINENIYLKRLEMESQDSADQLSYTF